MNFLKRTLSLPSLVKKNLFNNKNNKNFDDKDDDNVYISNKLQSDFSNLRQHQQRRFSFRKSWRRLTGSSTTLSSRPSSELDNNGILTNVLGASTLTIVSEYEDINKPKKMDTVDVCKKRPLSIGSTTSSNTSSLSRPQRKKMMASSVPQNDSYLLNICIEIVQTEAVFQKDLREIIQAYLIPLRTMATLSPELLESIFCNIEQVLEFSKDLLTELEKVVYIPESFADIFVERIQAFDQVYFKYCSNFQRAQAACNRCLCNPIHTGILQDLKMKYGHQFNLNDYLLKPVQRILKYPLLLTRMLEKSDTDLKPHVNAALQAMQNLATRLNNFNNHLRLYSQMPEAYVYGEIFHFGNLRVLESKGQRQVYLFETALLIVKIKEPEQNFTDRLLIDCKHLTLIEIIPEGLLCFRIVHFYKPDITVTFKAANAKEKKVWCDLIKRRIMMTFEKKLPERIVDLVMKMGPIERKINSNSQTTTDSFSKRLSFRRMSTTFLPDVIARNLRQSTTSSTMATGASTTKRDITPPLANRRELIHMPFSTSQLDDDSSTVSLSSLRRSKSFESVENLILNDRTNSIQQVEESCRKIPIEDVVSLYADEGSTDDECDKGNSFSGFLAVGEDLEESTEIVNNLKEEEESLNFKPTAEKDKSMRSLSVSISHTEKHEKKPPVQQQSTLAKYNRSPPFHNFFYKQNKTSPKTESRIGERMAENDPPSFCAPYTLERRRKNGLSTATIIKNPASIIIRNQNHGQFFSQNIQQTNSDTTDSVNSPATTTVSLNKVQSIDDIYEKHLDILEFNQTNEDDDDDDDITPKASPKQSRVKRALSLFETKSSFKKNLSSSSLSSSSSSSLRRRASSLNRNNSTPNDFAPNLKYDGIFHLVDSHTRPPKPPPKCTKEQSVENTSQTTKPGWVKHVVDKLECGQVTNTVSEC